MFKIYLITLDTCNLSFIPVQNNYQNCSFFYLLFNHFKKLMDNSFLRPSRDKDFSLRYYDRSPTQCTGDSIPWMKTAGAWVDQSPPSSAEVKNLLLFTCSCESHPAVQFIYFFLKRTNSPEVADTSPALPWSPPVRNTQFRFIARPAIVAAMILVCTISRSSKLKYPVISVLQCSKNNSRINDSFVLCTVYVLTYFVCTKSILAESEMEVLPFVSQPPPPKVEVSWLKTKRTKKSREIRKKLYWKTEYIFHHLL